MKVSIATVNRVCSKCGNRIFADAPQGFCSLCLFKTALGALGDDDTVIKSNAAERPTEFEGYELLEEIGRGGQGVVYRAQQKSLNRTVALKVIGVGAWATESHLRRFRREAEAAASLNHPSIVPIHEIGECEGYCYYSMNLIEGGQLDEIVRRELLPTRRAAEIIARLARTVHYAHEHGILHRDIKPGNVLLDREGEPHLTDFGLARLIETESDVTRSTDVLGTPGYMAPEQATGGSAAVTSASDTYGLGAVLYQLLTGRPPFAGKTSYETVRLLLETDPAPLRSLNPKIDRDLSTICLKCLEKDPRRRYPSALALAEDLERWLRREPIQARRAGVFVRGKKWLQRKPMTAIAGVLLAGLIIAVAIIISKSELFSAAPTSGIAVLPFANLSEDKSNAYFADAIQDEILTRLAKIGSMRVIARTSTQHYVSRPANLPEIARQLAVAHILEGSVQKSAEGVHVNVQLIKAANNSHLWTETFDRNLSDILSLENEIALAIADKLRATLTRQEEAAITAKPTDKPAAYDAYLRGLANTLKPNDSPANAAAAQKDLKQAVGMDPNFDLAWALLSYVDAHGFLVGNLQPSVALREEAGQAAEMALSLQPSLGEALHAKGYYHYACLKDYATAERYLGQAHRVLPNNSQVLESLAYVARRRGNWSWCESYLNEAERLDPRNLPLLHGQKAIYEQLHRFPEALRKLDQILNIVPDHMEGVAEKALIAQAQGDLTRAAAILAPLEPTADEVLALEVEAYQAILERRPMRVIPRLKEILSTPHPSVGFYEGELRYFLGWAEEVAGDHLAALDTWQHARRELEAFLEKESENYHLIRALALVHACLGDKPAALHLVQRDMAAHPIEKNAVDGFKSMETLALVAARTGERDRAISILEKLRSLPGTGPLELATPLTSAILRLEWRP